MKRQLSCLPMLLAVAGLGWFGVADVRGEADAFAQLSFTGFSITPNAPGSVGLTSLQGTASGLAGANNMSGAGVAPSVNVAGSFSSAQASAMTPGTLALNVSGQGYSSVEVPQSIIGADAATSMAGVNGQFMITGGSGQVSTTFYVPFTGFLLGYTDDAGQSAAGETLLRLTLDGSTILMDDRTSSIAANNHDGQTFMTSMQVNMMLNYNEVYTFDLEAKGLAMTSNVPEPGAWALLAGGLGVVGAGRFWGRRRVL